tara:strand:+ start:1177 stop:1374 length:198 start_codon:yes stop_codon:yes gene_type:complete
MSPRVREIVRFVTIGLAFGLVWATVQYVNGQIRDFAVLIGPVLVFGAAGLLMWVLRQAVIRFRNR